MESLLVTPSSRYSSPADYSCLLPSAEEVWNSGLCSHMSVGRLTYILQLGSFSKILWSVYCTYLGPFKCLDRNNMDTIWIKILKRDCLRRHFLRIHFRRLSLGNGYYNLQKNLLVLFLLTFQKVLNLKRKFLIKSFPCKVKLVSLKMILNYKKMSNNTDLKLIKSLCRAASAK